MRSKNTKIKDKQIILLERFQADEKLTVLEIMDLLECNRTSAYNYIKRLEESGYILTKEQIKNKVYYSLNFHENKESDAIQYYPMTADILRKFTIIRELQEGAIKKEELRKHFTVYRQDGLYNGEEQVPLDIKPTQYYKLLNDLIEEGEIVLDQEEQKYYLTGYSIPLQITLNEDDLVNMQIELSTIPAGTPYYEQLKELYISMSLLLGSIDSDTPYIENYLTYGKKMNGFSTVTEQLKKITTYDYKNKVLQITYLSNQSQELTLPIATGMIIYSVEKDKFYLLGEDYSIEDQLARPRYTIIDIAKIIDVHEKMDSHSCFHSQFFESIFDAMFSISIEPPVNVIVEFERVANVERKVKYLQMQRKNASIQVQENKILYTDQVSGLADFANYLRRFGKSARVIEPLLLKEKMRQSVELSLARYEEEHT